MKKGMLLLCLLFCLCGCGAQTASDRDRLRIVTTDFPLYDFARTIAGERASVTVLLKPGAEVHTFEPTPKEIMQIEQCDLFLLIGGESEEWVRQLLPKEAPPRLALIECVPTLAEEDEPEADEHIWTSPSHAMLMCRAICERICELDPAHEREYRERTEEYLGQLETLDRSFADVVSSARENCLVFGDRFAFRYFADRYGLEAHAAFPGCAEQSEPNARVVAQLIDLVRERHLPLVLYPELSNHRLADAIAEAAGAKTRMFHSCHNVTAEEMERGESYLSLMTQNLEVLKEALGA